MSLFFNWLVAFSLLMNGAVKIKPQSKIRLKVNEPSDIAYTKDKNYLVVSDGGTLLKLDNLGKIILKAKQTGIDFEGVIELENLIYVSDETTRKIMIYDATTLEYVKSYQLQLQRASNSGFESIAYNSKKERFILVTEKNPITIQEYSKEFVLQGEITFTSVRDISAASFYNGSLFLLSDEDHLLMKLSENYEIEKTWDLNLLNPEGFCFDENNNLIVISDDLEMLYNFGKIE
jgi:uncharacterized protein YjiK